MRVMCGRFGLIGIVLLGAGHAAGATSAETGGAASGTADAAVENRAGALPEDRLRILDEITIEGALQVPQVLFISGRDQWRTLTFGHDRYLETARDVCESAPLPSGLWVTWSLPDEHAEAADETEVMNDDR